MVEREEASSPDDSGTCCRGLLVDGGSRELDRKNCLQ